MFDVRWC